MPSRLLIRLEKCPVVASRRFAMNFRADRFASGASHPGRNRSSLPLPGPFACPSGRPTISRSLHFDELLFPLAADGPGVKAERTRSAGRQSLSVPFASAGHRQARPVLPELMKLSSKGDRITPPGMAVAHVARQAASGKFDRPCAGA